MVNNERVLITGGSGFIGTNFINQISQDDYEILNLDVAPPKNESHFKYWKKCNILDEISLNVLIKEFQPKYVIHLAARTDLGGSTLEDYQENTLGVANLLNILTELESVKHAVFTSSMLVTTLGDEAKKLQDCRPDTIYGLSKVEGEKLVKQNAREFTWTIVRPTTIWGPYFSHPYDQFFQLNKKKVYFHPKGQKITRSFGYVENICTQLLFIMKNGDKKFSSRTLYLSDFWTVDLLRFASEIREAYGHEAQVLQLPKWIFGFVARIGDAFEKVGFTRFPLNNRRLKNMLTNSIIVEHELRMQVGDGVIPLKECIRRTINWLEEN